MANKLPDAQRNLRRVLLAACIVVYLAAVGVLIAVASDAPLRALLDVKYALIAYCCIVIVCLGAMFIFVRRVPIVSGVES